MEGELGIVSRHRSWGGSVSQEVELGSRTLYFMIDRSVYIYTAQGAAVTVPHETKLQDMIK